MVMSKQLRRVTALLYGSSLIAFGFSNTPPSTFTPDDSATAAAGSNSADGQISAVTTVSTATGFFIGPEQPIATTTQPSVITSQTVSIPKVETTQSSSTVTKSSLSSSTSTPKESSSISSTTSASPVVPSTTTENKNTHPSSSGQPSGPTPLAQPMPSAASSSSSGLNTAAKMGIGLGIPLAVCLGAIVSFLLIRYFRRRDKQTAENGNGIEEVVSFNGIEHSSEAKGVGQVVAKEEDPRYLADWSEYLGPERKAEQLISR